MCIARIVTVPERKANEAARRKQAADAIALELQAYARKHGGKFVLFGSYVTDSMRYDSDPDVLIDFPVEDVGEAWRFAEESAGRHRIPIDLHDAPTTKAAFIERVRSQGKVLA